MQLISRIKDSIGLPLVRFPKLGISSTLLEDTIPYQPRRLATPIRFRELSTMKRKEPPLKANATAKKARIEVPEYHLTPSNREEDGSIQWPAPKVQMERAQEFIKTW